MKWTAFLAFTMFLPVMAHAEPINIEGIWWTEGQRGKVEVKDCGDGTPCATLIWFDETGADTLNDINNPDPALRNQPLKGSRVFWGFEKKKDKWKSGTIYDAESGKTYKSKLTLKDDGTLKVKGCVGPICAGETWTRVTDSPQP